LHISAASSKMNACHSSTASRSICQISRALRSTFVDLLIHVLNNWVLKEKHLLMSRNICTDDIQMLVNNQCNELCATDETCTFLRGCTRARQFTIISVSVPDDCYYTFNMLLCYIYLRAVSPSNLNRFSQFFEQQTHQ